MALIKGFQSTTVWRAFILNALATSFGICVAIILRSHYDSFTDKKGDKITVSHTINGMFATFVITFLATFTGYAVLHIIFGYGRGMLAE